MKASFCTQSRYQAVMTLLIVTGIITFGTILFKFLDTESSVQVGRMNIDKEWIEGRNLSSCKGQHVRYGRVTICLGNVQQ
jgi:hypothetical protein